MKTLLKAGIFVVVSAIGVAAYFHYADAPKPPVISQLMATRGDVVQAVTATGTLTPTRTVEIGSQVSGQVSHVYVDYNSLVKEGQILARIDPALFEQKLDSSKATLAQAQIVLEEHKTSLVADQHILARTEELFDHGVVSQTDREAILLQVKEDQAQLTQDQSSISVANAQVEQAQVDVDHCTITSPIDGVVIERDVDDGQAVASGVQAPKLFVLATNLRNLELMGDIDEAFISQLSPGQEATFTVPDYPRDTFHGVLSSVRLNATETNSVITYKAVIDVANPNLRLRPSMTAQITMNVWRESNVLRVPNLALRFRPTHDVFEAFGETAPDAMRLSSNNGAPSPNAVRASPSSTNADASARQSVDQYFKNSTPLETTGQVYVLENGRLKRVTLMLGITDGTWTAVESGELQPEQLVVTAVALPGVTTQTGNPLAPRFGAPGGGGAGGAGGGRGATPGR